MSDATWGGEPWGEAPWGGDAPSGPSGTAAVSAQHATCSAAGSVRVYEAIIDDSSGSPAFATAGSAFVAASGDASAAGYAGTQLFCDPNTSPSSSNKAIYTFTGVPPAPMTLWGTWDATGAVSGVNIGYDDVQYQVHYGSNTNGNLDQSSNPSQLTIGGVAWEPILTFTPSSTTVTVDVLGVTALGTDYTAGHFIFADAFRLADAGGYAALRTSPRTSTGSGTVGIPTGTAAVTHHPTASGSAHYSDYTGSASVATKRRTAAGSALKYGPGEVAFSIRGTQYPEWLDRMTLAVRGVDSLQKSATLYIAAGDPNDSGAPMNLYVRGGGSTITGGAPLYVRCEPPFASFLPISVSGDGVFPGSLPVSSPMNLFVQRGPQAGCTLFIANGGIESSAPLSISGVPASSGTTTLTVSGDGGTPTGSVDLSIDGVDLAEANASATLAIPQAVGAPSATTTLFVGGF